MKILYVSAKTPEPSYDGSAFAIRSLIACLPKKASIDAIIFETKKHPISEESNTFFNAFFDKTKTLFVDTRIKIIPLLIQLCKGKSYHFSRWKTPNIDGVISELSSTYDLIICDGIYSAINIDELKKVSNSLIIRSHNVEHLIWEQQSKNETGPKKYLLSLMSKFLKKEEIQLLKKANQIWSISREDQVYFEAQGIHTPIHYLPVSVDFEYQTNGNPVPRKKPIFFFLGAMNWQPNIESVDFLLKLWTTFSFPLKIAGRESEKLVIKNKHINKLGFVIDLNTFYHSVDILVCPIFSGSGIRIKILEALSHGKTIITTKIGAQGINIEHLPIHICETKEDFCKTIKRLERDFTENISGIDYINKNHALEKIKNDILQYF